MKPKQSAFPVTRVKKTEPPGNGPDWIIWAAAAAGQVCEFAVVGAYVGPTLPYVFYVVFWSLYGGWALLSLRGFPDSLNKRETGYSVLSTLAKLSVFISSGMALGRRSAI